MKLTTAAPVLIGWCLLLPSDQRNQPRRHRNHCGLAEQAATPLRSNVPPA